MPSWPTQSDYKDSLQNPDTAFRDRELQASQAERSSMGVPRARSGAFASVYKMTRGSKAIALKLFNFPNEDRAGRYQAVSDYLKELGPKKPGALVGFEYHPEGIRVGKWWYPTLTMEWVRGKSLGEWVREAMERRNPDVVGVRARRFVGPARRGDSGHRDRPRRPPARQRYGRRQPTGPGGLRRYVRAGGSRRPIPRNGSSNSNSANRLTSIRCATRGSACTSITSPRGSS